MTDVVAWLHPALGLVAVGAAARAASLALTARRGGRAALAARTSHRLVAPTTLGLMIASWLLGVGTVWLVRQDLEPFASRHAGVGCLIVLLLVGSAVTSRFRATVPRARAVHPWLGAAALVASAVQVFLGLQLVRW